MLISCLSLNQVSFITSETSSERTVVDRDLKYNMEEKNLVQPKAKGRERLLYIYILPPKSFYKVTFAIKSTSGSYLTLIDKPYFLLSIKRFVFFLVHGSFIPTPLVPHMFSFFDYFKVQLISCFLFPVFHHSTPTFPRTCRHLSLHYRNQ